MKKGYMVKTIILLCLMTSPAFAATAALSGLCTQGGTQAQLSGMSSTNYQQGIIPSCTVTVYLTGTQTKATIYADGSGTPLSNPFTANAATSVNPGGWILWTTVNQGYDVVLSGGIAPNTYPQPVTLTAQYPGFSFSGGGGSGDVLPTPQYRMFLQPNSGTQAVAAGAMQGQNGVAPMLQGNLNPDLYATGSGNNGVSNSLASTDCTSGCTFAVPQTSTDVETIPNVMVARNVPYTHGLDNRYGVNTHTFFNAGNNNAGSNGIRWVNGHNYFWNDQPNTPNQRIEADLTNYISSGAGMAIGQRAPLPTLFQWTLTHAHNTNMWDWTRGIGQVYPATFNCYKVGDCMLQEQYLYFRSGATIDSDEGVKATSVLMQQQASPYGTISVGGANATLVKSTFTNNVGMADGLNLVSTSEVMDSFNVTGQGSQGGILPNYLTTSNTHAISTAIGVLSANCGANTARNAPKSATCSITLSSGSFTANAGDTVCVGDVHYDEQAAITSASSTSLTLNLTYAHPTGTPIYQGGGCGGKAVWGYGLADPASNHNFVSFEIVGSRTATTYDYVIEVFGGVTTPIPAAVIPSLPSVPFLTLSRVGNVVTAVINGGVNSGVPYNSFVAPGASTLQISGATPSDLNGIVTNVHATPGKMTWTQTGADESGTGGTLNIVDYNNMSVYCGAQTTKVDGIGMDANGQATVSNPTPLEVEANNCSWPVGQMIAQSNQTNNLVTGHATFINGYTPSFLNPTHASTLQMSGALNSGAVAMNFVAGDQLSAMQGHGGTIVPHALLVSTDYYGTMFNFRNPPLDGNSMFIVGCPVEGCVSTAYDYDLFNLSGVGGAAEIKFRPSSNTFNFSRPVTNNGYTYATQSIGVSTIYSSAPGSTPGVPGMGGYLEAVGQPGTDNNTLCVGNGLQGDCSGTLGAATLVGASTISGVPTPSVLNVVPTPPGSTSYTYKCTATTANGETNPITVTIATGPSALTGSTYNQITCPAVPGATGIKVYRTAGGPSTGLIKTLTNITASSNTTVAFNDTGLAGDGTSPPATNTTGLATVYGPLTATSAALGSGTVAGSPICTVASPCSAPPALVMLTLGTTAVAAGACSTVVTAAYTGLATTSTIIATPNVDPSGVTGYGAGGLQIWVWPTAGQVNAKVCNPTAASITPGALTINAATSGGTGGGGGGMIYPGAGISVSMGSAWGSSLTAPTGALVGTTDTQTLTNKTVDGVTPTTLGFLDATSSIQTQLNAKQSTLTLTTTGTSGAATLTGGALNIPQYTGISGLAAGYIPLATSSTAIGNSLLDYGVTTASTFTFGAPVRVNDASGLGGGIDGTEGTAPAGSSGVDNFWADSTSHRYMMNNNNGGAVTVASLSDLASSSAFGVVKVDGTTITASGGVISAAGGGIANITVTLPTTAIAANTCTAPATATMTGVTTSSAFSTAFATNPNAVTGWGSSGGLTFTAWPTANTLNWSVCNQTAASITPGAMTLNVGAR